MSLKGGLSSEISEYECSRLDITVKGLGIPDRFITQAPGDGAELPRA